MNVTFLFLICVWQFQVVADLNILYQLYIMAYDKKMLTALTSYMSAYDVMCSWRVPRGLGPNASRGDVCVSLKVPYDTKCAVWLFSNNVFLENKNKKSLLYFCLTCNSTWWCHKDTSPSKYAVFWRSIQVFGLRLVATAVSSSTLPFLFTSLSHQWFHTRRPLRYEWFLTVIIITVHGERLTKMAGYIRRFVDISRLIHCFRSPWHLVSFLRVC